MDLMTQNIIKAVGTLRQDEVDLLTHVSIPDEDKDMLLRVLLLGELRRIGDALSDVPSLAASVGDLKMSLMQLNGTLTLKS